MTNTKLLKSKIVEKGYTQTELANLLKISSVSMNYKINNKRMFNVDEIVKLCSILEITNKDKYFFTWYVA